MNQWNVSSSRRRKEGIYSKKNMIESNNQKEAHRFMNIANEIVNKRRIKFNGWMELAIAIRHLS
jgi:hypothetical protein